MYLKDSDSAATKKKRRCKWTVVISEIVTGEVYRTSQVRLQRMFVCRKAKP